MFLCLSFPKKFNLRFSNSENDFYLVNEVISKVVGCMCVRVFEILRILAIFLPILNYYA